jgi:glycosyltransferase involved in cell wall biosynthesis
MGHPSSLLPHILQKREDVGHLEPVHPEVRFAQREREHAERVVAACAGGKFNVVLDHSGHFFRHAGRVETTVLATLHLPRELYAADAFEGLAKNVYFNCVSDSQRSTFMDLPRVLGVVRNGLAVERFSIGGQRSDYVLWLGRICPEKAPHLAIEAAQRAGLRIVVAGQVYPFRWHEEYWEREVKPRIDGERVRWVMLPSFAEKTKLLREARALLVTSQIAETTSLVALEAMASGTPVIAFDTGALRDVVPKDTGFIVNNVEEMAKACGAVSGIRALACRKWVEKQYSVRAMADGYEALIGDLEEQRRLECSQRHA